MPTTSIKDVAARAGVSLGTVSNVLNRPSIVSEPTRNRVLQAITELGFVRNEAARALRSGRSRTIGLVVLDVANPFFTDVARGAEEAADRCNALLTLCNSGADARRERRHLDHLEEQRVRGVLLSPVEDGPNAKIEELVGRGIPVVLVDRGAGHGQRCSVAVDDMLGGRLAANHLVECGHRRVAFVGGPTNVRQVAERYAGAQSALHEHGGRLDLFESQALTITAGRAAGDELLTVPVADRPTAAFCANDLLALGLLQRLMAAGLDVPGDIAIVGYDDIEYASAAAVPLSSIRQPREDLGRTAAELLFEEINDPQHRHRQVLFQPEIIVRESTEGRGHGASNGRLGAELGRRALDTDRAAPAAG